MGGCTEVHYIREMQIKATARYLSTTKGLFLFCFVSVFFNKKVERSSCGEDVWKREQGKYKVVQSVRRPQDAENLLCVVGVPLQVCMSLSGCVCV